MLKEKFKQRFIELEEQMNAMRFHPDNTGWTSETHVKPGDWKGWATSAQNLINAIFTEQSPQSKNFGAEYDLCNGYESQINTLKGLFLAAKSDFEGGYVFNFELHISGEIFGDFLTMAKHSLSEGHKDVSAVLACAALEDTLKRYATLNGLNVDDKSMEEVVSALKSNSLVSGAQKTLLDAMPKIRNFAMHANWGKLTEPDVNSVIGFVEQFLLSKFC